MEGSPFDQEAVAEARMDLRLICKSAGHGDGLPQEGDIVQAYEVRLIQALLSAFADPDCFFVRLVGKRRLARRTGQAVATNPSGI